MISRKEHGLMYYTLVPLGLDGAATTLSSLSQAAAAAYPGTGICAYDQIDTSQ